MSDDRRQYEVPYDRELIRSGGVSDRRSRDQRAELPRYDEPRTRYRAPRRERSGGRLIGRALAIAMLAIVVVAVVIGVRAAAFNASVSSAPFPSSSLFGELTGSERVNVLLVGYGGPNHGGPFLADSIQIMSIDPSTDTTTTIPIPRDFWIEGVDGYDRASKVNEAFSVGNAEGGLDRAGSLLAQVLSSVTGLRIDHAISIDYDGFRDMVDAVGGVTIDNPTAFSYIIEAMTKIELH